LYHSGHCTLFLSVFFLCHTTLHGRAPSCVRCPIPSTIHDLPGSKSS
jgi:hypothetical protein